MNTVCFFGTVLASAQKTLVSPRIGHPYIIREIRARFAQGCNNLVKNYFIVSIDQQETAAGIPNGQNILAHYGHVDYVTGNDDTKVLKSDARMEERGSYIKVHAVNADTFDHSVDVQITIEEIER